MSPNPHFTSSPLARLGLSAFLAFPCGARAWDALSSGEEITAVSSKVYGGYVRTKLRDGAFRPESYAFGNGGFVRNGTPGVEEPLGVFTRDDTIDDIAFGDVARIIAGPLAGQNYLPARDPRTTSLLIMVFWGRTIGTSAFPGSGLTDIPLGTDIDKIDAHNAVLLGFDSEGVFGQGFGYSIGSNILKQLHSGVMSAIKADRYYVIMRAFDFQSAWRQKRIKLLWETRFSLSQRRHDFGKDLPGMTQFASKYFGQDSHGLVLNPPAEGRVDIGDVRSLGPVPEK